MQRNAELERNASTEHGCNFNLEPGLFFLIWGVCLGFAVITTHLFDVIVVLLRLLFVALRLLLKKGLKATSTSIYGYGYDIRFR